MAKNEKLDDVVLGAMIDYFISIIPNQCPISAEQKEIEKEALRDLSTYAVDEMYKIRLHFDRNIGYGYDFSQKDDDDESAEKVYRRAMDNTKKLGAMMPRNIEKLVADGIVDDRYGWYITQFPD